MGAEHASDDARNFSLQYRSGVMFMQVKFGAQERPRKIRKDEATATPVYAKFIIEPFERVFGHSVGNALRRALLSSLETPGIISFRIEGVPHEFMAVEGIVEDVVNIMLNVKGSLLRRLPSDETNVSRDVRFVTSVVDVSRELLDQKGGKFAVTLGDVMKSSPFEVVNPELVLFTVTKPMKRQVDFRVGFGRGYVSADRQEIPNKM
jgi:DNA-directed RNA polymerase subunit alpha